MSEMDELKRLWLSDNPDDQAKAGDLMRQQSEAVDKYHKMMKLINSPETEDFLRGVKFESAHQIERWGTTHDQGKTVTDWYWLIGYLGGKALFSFLAGDLEKAKHHTISCAAACLNWHRAITGESAEMRPGTETPDV